MARRSLARYCAEAPPSFQGGRRDQTRQRGPTAVEAPRLPVHVLRLNARRSVLSGVDRYAHAQNVTSRPLSSSLELTALKPDQVTSNDPDFGQCAVGRITEPIVERRCLGHYRHADAEGKPIGESSDGGRTLPTDPFADLRSSSELVNPSHTLPNHNEK